MKYLNFIVASVVTFSLRSQPIQVNNAPYANVTSTAYDSINNKIFYNYIYGCPTWNIPCALNYSLFSQHNLINKHSYSDNNLMQVQGSKYQVACPSYPVNNYNSGFSRQSIYHQNSIYTNFGYFFNRIDSSFANPVPIWTYSPATNPSYKEISTFEIKGDSIFLFQKDSTSGFNYYTLMVKNKLNGANIPYNSINQAVPSSSLGAIEGYINASSIIGNKIILAGAFTASVSGIQIARNLISLNILTGQISAPTASFAVGSKILDLKTVGNKIAIAGQFVYINGLDRHNFAYLDQSLNLLPDTLHFNPGPFDSFSNTWLDKIIFYDKYLVAKGNFAKINNAGYVFWNTYMVKVVDTQSNNAVMNWTISLPGTPTLSDFTFEMVKNKLYIKNRPDFGSNFRIYCFEPISASTNILYPGSTLPNPNFSINICAPDNGTTNTFVAPIRYATTYSWTYSGSNATLIPLGNGSSAQLVLAANATSGTLSVNGTNDCGLTVPFSTLLVNVNAKPSFTLPVSPQTIICNPDSTILQGSSTNTNATIFWRKALTNNYYQQPYYCKTPGTYHMITTDIVTGCKDSGLIQVIANQVLPNSKISSHIYPGPFTSIDTVTCLQPLVTIIGASDSSGTVISWKTISNNSVYPNPFSTSMQNNMKVIATRTLNNCVDSSLIVLVGQNTTKPNVSLANNVQTINCSIYTASLNAAWSPSNCSAIWSGPLSYTSSNPGVTTNAGKYYFTATDPDNGCSRIDSCQVNYSPAFVLTSSNDTTVCKSTVLVLSSIRQGTLPGVTYSWSSGANQNSITISPTITTTYYVFASGAGGCSGSDSIKVTIPSDIKDSIVSYRNCNNNNTGSIIAFAKGGISPYQFSINNGQTFGPANSFTNQPFGTYTLVIKDSIGCTKSSTVNISASSDLPVPKFLASTKNFSSDTVVLVDISIPKPDSVQWQLPQQANIIGGDMFNPIVAVSDTGTFVFTMRSFYGSCTINTTKSLHFSPTDSLHANDYNNNGIKTFSLFPNPNNGTFTVYIEFYKSQDASIQVLNNVSEKLLQQNFYDATIISIPFNLTQLINGSYILRVTGEYDYRSRVFIISK